MKQIFKLLLACTWLCFSVTAFSMVEDPEDVYSTVLNNIPEVPHIDNFSYDEETGTVSFTDNSTYIKQSSARAYTILFAQRNPDNKFIKIGINKFQGYDYAINGNRLDGSAIFLEHGKYVTLPVLNKEKKVSFKVPTTLLSTGINHLRMFVLARYKIDSVDDFVYPYSETESKAQFLVNYYDIDVPFIPNGSITVQSGETQAKVQCNDKRLSNSDAITDTTVIVSASDPALITVEADSLTVPVNTQVVLQYQFKKMPIWLDVKKGFTTAKGIQFDVEQNQSYNGDIDRYRLMFIIPNADSHYKPDTLYSDYTIALKYQYQYKIKDEKGATTISERFAGDTIERKGINTCDKTLKITCDKPVTLKHTDNSIYFVMPSANVKAEITDNVHYYTFYDMDGSIIKKAEVKKSGAFYKVPSNPTAPTHEGYTFVEWQKNEYGDCGLDATVRAIYSCDAFKDKCTFSEYKHKSKHNLFEGSETQIAVTDTISIDVNIQFETAVNVALQAGTPGNWTISKEKSITKAKAATGTKVTPTFVLLREYFEDYVNDKETSQLNDESIRELWFRVLITSNNKDTFETTPVKYQVHHVMNISSNADAIIITADSSYLLDGAVIAPQFGDTLFLNEVDGHNSCLYAYDMEIQENEAGQTYFVFPAEVALYDKVGIYSKIYHLTFSIGDGTIADNSLLKQDVLCGHVPTNPGIPTLEGYIFAGWNHDINIAPSDKYGGSYLSYSAIWAKEGEIHTVRFVHSDGTLIDEVIVKDGYTAYSPVVELYRDGFTFDHWEGNMTSVTEDREIVAVYKKGNAVDDILNNKDAKVNKYIKEGRVYVQLPDGRTFLLNGTKVK